MSSVDKTRTAVFYPCVCTVVIYSKQVTLSSVSECRELQYERARVSFYRTASEAGVALARLTSACALNHFGRPSRYIVLMRMVVSLSIHKTQLLPVSRPGSDAYASDKGVFVKPTRAGVSSGWHSPSRRVWKGLKQ